jgi:hypothetical protein
LLELTVGRAAVGVTRRIVRRVLLYDFQFSPMGLLGFLKAAKELIVESKLKIPDGKVRIERDRVRGCLDPLLVFAEGRIQECAQEPVRTLRPVLDERFRIARAAWLGSLCALALLVVSISSLSAGDTRYFTKLVHDTDAPLQIEVPTGIYMEITDFKQSQIQGPAFASVVATKSASQTGISVLVANSDKRVVLAGPITATVTPLPGSTLLITYLLGRN